MRHFCTYFDLNYLPRGLALYRSLLRVCPSFQLWVLCMDTGSYNALNDLRLPELQIIALEDFERANPRVLATKGSRSRLEYYFTCTPSLPLHILSQETNLDMITYLDADLYFFSDIEPIFEEFGGHAIGITGHRFPARLLHLENHGRYNVGWLTFRNNSSGLECLEWWRDRCIEWCYDRLENGRFADQKYLDEWPVQFPKTKVLEHAGLNVGPWNLGGCVLTRTPNGILIDGEPLVCFHFHGFKRIWSWLYDPNLKLYGASLSSAIRRGIFYPYLKELELIQRDLVAIPVAHAPSKKIFRGGGQTFLHQIRDWLRIFKRALTRQCLIQVKGRVF